MVETHFSAFDSARESLLEEFFTLLRYKSISTDPEFRGAVAECAEWVEIFLSETGFTVERWNGGGHPVIFASWMNAGPSKPTVLLYGHYDVQPVDPIELWSSPPFEPEIRNGEIFARGAVDNKGQLFYTMAAIRSLMQRTGSLPVNIKFVIEGEEEAGSESLLNLIDEKSAALKADHLFIVDVGFESLESPAVVLGCRGLVAFELELRGSNTDLHSGLHGGIAYNPNRAMVELLSQMVDSAGRVAIPGFYDDIQELSPEDRAQYSIDFSTLEYENMFDARPLGGELRYTAGERRTLRPTIEINGIAGGYAGVGFKTVIPAVCHAKISCRLVPNQDPERIGKLVVEFLKERCPQAMMIKVEAMHSGRPLRSAVGGRGASAARQSISEVLKRECFYSVEGGSIPIGNDLARASGAEVSLIGFCLPGDAIHAPNEKFSLDRMRVGFATICRLVEILGA